MSKYADIEQIKEVIRSEWVKYIPMDLDINLSFVLGKISEVPTIEVEDAISSKKEGDWIESPYEDADGMPAYRCSECGCLCAGGYNYCFKCGAKMRDDNVETD